MNVAKHIYNQLVRYNVENVFMYSGGAIMPLIDCFYKNDKIKYYINSHEQNCGHAATGYAKSSGKTGVVLVTSGPGITNCVTPLLDATNDSTPLIVISANVPLSAIGTQAFQEAPAVEITKPVTKWSYMVNKDDDIEHILEKAFYIANDKKKGSVHIDIPKCILTKKYIFKTNYLSRSYIKNYKVSHDLDKICNIISEAEKPILYVGKGANNISKFIRLFSKMNNIPVTTTMHGMGIVDETDDLSLQMCGMHGNGAANFALQESDCIIAVGSRFDDRTIGNKSKYAPNCKNFIHFNIEEKEINKIIDTQYYIVGNLEYTFLNFFEKYKNKKYNKNWLERIDTLKNQYKFTYNKSNNLKTQEVLIELNKQITNNMEKYFITTGVGNHQMMSCQFIDWKVPNRFISSGSLGVMGAGLPYAIGTQIANPEHIVINIDGDSSFLMTLTDLKTIKEHNLPVKILLMNNGTQDMVRVWETLFFDGRITATKNKSNPFFDNLAESFGIKGSICNNKLNLSKQIKYFLEYDGPILMNCIVEPDFCFPLVQPGAGLDEMILTEDDIITGSEVPS